MVNIFTLGWATALAGWAIAVSGLWVGGGRVFSADWRAAPRPPRLLPARSMILAMNPLDSRPLVLSMQSQIAPGEVRITVVQDEIAKVAESLKAVKSQVADVGARIETAKIALKQSELQSDDKAILMMDLKRLMNEEESLMDEKKSLMDQERRLQEAMGAMYVEMHIKWTRDGQMTTTADSGPYQSHGRTSFALGQDFAKVRRAQNSYVVDKSAFIFEFLKTPYVVFRRPRRFGKSLFLSMLKYFFYGATDLFKGMAVYDQTIYDRYDAGRFVWCPSDASKHYWPPVPVIHLDFSSLKGCETAEIFSTKLTALLAVVGDENKFAVELSNEPQVALNTLIRGLSKQPLNERQKVVVLIDEYDAPLNERASDEVSNKILSVYQKFFTELKALDQYIDFAYVTGITSYGMAGIYSGANNFLDLTHSATFESMCAITEEEFRAAFEATHPQDPPMSSDEMVAIKVQYNGYSWDLEQREKSKRHTLFNPYFVAMYCNSGKMDDYWGHTTSASLIARFPVIVAIDVNARSSSVIKRSDLKRPWFSSHNSLQDCVRNLFEAGYVTVVDVIDDTPDSSDNFATPLDADVHLGVPNEQIRKLFKSNYLSSLLPTKVRESPAFLAGRAAIKDGDMVTLFKSLNDLYDSIPYQITSGFAYEKAWHVLAFTALSSMGLGDNLVAEDSSQAGRSDIAFFVNNVLFVVELKAVSAKGKTKPLEREARAAIKQIGGGYLKSVFVTSRLGRASKVVLVGVVADTAIGKRGFAMIATSEVNPNNVSMPMKVNEYQLLQLEREE